MRIGIFGGSFDPVHIEHIRVAQSAIKGLGLDKLLIMPAYAPPHKPYKALAPDKHRLAACRLAFADVEKAEVCDFEIAQKGTSYTYLTCRHFKQKYPSAELFWLVGTDMLRDFPTWREPESILTDARLAVCARNEQDGWLEAEQAAFYQKFHKRFAVVSYNGADVSSTKIRVLAGAGEDISALVGEKVASYVQEHKLYSIDNAAEALALEKPERAAHSLRVAELAAVKAHKDLLVGCFEKNKNERAYILVSYGEPTIKESNSVELTFKTAKKLAVRRNGVKEIVEIKDGKLSIEMKHGEGIYIQTL